MNIDEIRYFLAVYESSSISKAAEEMHISSQGLGKSLKRLEQKLGVRLFVRTPMGIVPTEEATYLADKFAAMERMYDDVRRYLKMRASEGGKERFFIGRESALGDAMRQGIEAYNETHKDTQVKAVFFPEPDTRLVQRFIDGGYDFRFVSQDLDVLDDLPRDYLCTLKFKAVVNAGSEYAKRGSVTLQDMRDALVLSPSDKMVWMKILKLKCKNAGISLKTRELPLGYIANLLSRPGNEITFIKEQEVAMLPWVHDEYRVIDVEPAFQTRVVLQTIHESNDQELVVAIRKSLEANGYL